MEEKKRIGKFEVSRQMVFEEPDNVAKVFTEIKCVPVRAECMFARDVIEYIAISEKFDKIGTGQVPPEYALTIHQDDKGNITGVDATRQEGT